MPVSFREVRRENVPLLVGLAGGTGSGKTFSALLLARGMAAGKPFAIVDTENGRAKHYADLFPEMRWAGITAPFRPEKYAAAIEAAAKDGFGVVVVDSASHEWAGDGGCLDWQEELMEGKESKRLQSWITPKREHKKFVTRLLQVQAHTILCFRAEPKSEMVDDPDKPGKKKIIPKRSVTGLDGWLPISEKMLPYELTASFLLMADAPGVPRPIKLAEQHKPFFPNGKPITEEMGRALAKWAAGSAARSPEPSNGAATVEQAGSPSPAAPDGSGVAPLTATEFKRATTSYMLAPPTIKEVGSRLFPGRTRDSLTDEERGELLAELLRGKVSA